MIHYIKVTESHWISSMSHLVWITKKKKISNKKKNLYCASIFQTKKHSLYKSIRLVVSHAKKQRNNTQIILTMKGWNNEYNLSIWCLLYYLFRFIVLWRKSIFIWHIHTFRYLFIMQQKRKRGRIFTLSFIYARKYWKHS